MGFAKSRQDGEEQQLNMRIDRHEVEGAAARPKNTHVDITVMGHSTRSRHETSSCVRDIAASSTMRGTLGGEGRTFGHGVESALSARSESRQVLHRRGVRYERAFASRLDFLLRRILCLSDY